MKKMLLSIAVLTLLHARCSACDKCGRSHHMAVQGSPAYLVAPSAVSSVPMSYVAPMTYSAPVAVSAAPLTFTTSSAQSLQFVQAQPSLVSTAPMYYAAAPATQAVLTTQPVAAPVSVYYTTDSAAALSSAQTQSLIGDLLIGIGGQVAKPAACEICKSLNCPTGSGSPPTDPIKSLKETISEIGALIKAVKGLEKDIKDAADGNVSVEEPPSVQDSELAKLTRLRDEVRAMNQLEKATRVAEGNR